MSFHPQFHNRAVRNNVVNDAARRAVESFRPDLPSRLVDGVFEGGGALGAAYSGALRYLHDNDIWFARVAGNSAGAITAAMIAAGYTAPEIQWLMSGYEGVADVPPGDVLPSLGNNEPISFSSFLDLPSPDTIDDQYKRKTLLWKALDLPLDMFAAIPLPTPTRSGVVDAIFGDPDTAPAVVVPAMVGLKMVEEAAREWLESDGGILGFLPKEPLRVEHFMPSERERDEFVDGVWDEMARRFPVMSVITNLLYEGSLFEGEAFRRTMARLLGKRVFGDENAKVCFKDLPIPLVVIAGNIHTHRMQVFSSRYFPNMEVAEAVRRSMSIPFVYQPAGQNKNMVDGGVCSNFPVWLLSESGRKYWAQSDVDDQRPKLGFVLEEGLDPARKRKPDGSRREPGEPGTAPGRFAASGNPPRVDSMEVLKPIIIETLNGIGLSGVAPTESSGEPETDVDVEKLKIIEVIDGLMRIDKETTSREVITRGLMDGMPYYDVVIPLLGFHWLDFSVNQDEEALYSMWDRAWVATKEALETARADLPALVDTNADQSPYHL